MTRVIDLWLIDLILIYVCRTVRVTCSGVFVIGRRSILIGSDCFPFLNLFKSWIHFFAHSFQAQSCLLVLVLDVESRIILSYYISTFNNWRGIFFARCIVRKFDFNSVKCQILRFFRLQFVLMLTFFHLFYLIVSRCWPSWSNVSVPKRIGRFSVLALPCLRSDFDQ